MELALLESRREEHASRRAVTVSGWEGHDAVSSEVPSPCPCSRAEKEERPQEPEHEVHFRTEGCQRLRRGPDIREQPVRDLFCPSSEAQRQVQRALLLNLVVRLDSILF